jgi:hypothetical protein
MPDAILEQQRPWRLEIELLQASGRTRTNAVNLVIIQWLRHGRAEPLIDAIYTGDIVDPVLSFIAGMLLPDKRLPYYLALRRRRGLLGARRKPDTFVRDICAAHHYEQRYKEVGHDQALLDAAAEFRMSETAVKSAVTRWRKLQAIDPPTTNKS